MSIASRALSLARGLFARERVEREMDAEMQFHIDARTQDLIDEGIAPHIAARRARMEFGSMDEFKEQGRESRGLRMFDEIRGDIRYGLRSLGRAPGFSFIALLTLALGIGATTAIFSALDAVLLRPLPFADPDRLVLLRNLNIPLSISGDEREKRMPEIRDAQALTDVFSQVAAYAPGGLNLSGSGAARRVRVGVVTRDFFSILGADVRGRAFNAAEVTAGGPRVAIVSHGFWQSHLGGTRDLNGRTITLNGRSHAVVGVAPRGFSFPEESEVWLPLPVPMTWDSWEPFRQYMPSRMIARLEPGVTLERAEARALALWAPFERADEPLDLEESMVAPLQKTLVGQRGTVLLVLLGATTLVLLVACANVANLLLSRGAARSREIAVRAALGATPARVARQLLVESVLLALLGGVIGIAVAYIGVQMLDALVPAALSGAAPIRLDLRVLTFSMLLAVVTGLAFGLLPALGARRTNAGDVLKGSGTGAVKAAGSTRLRQAFVLAELALAVMLLVGSALMLRSLHALLTTDSGVQPERVATLELSLAAADYPTRVERRQLYERLLDRLAAAPDIEAAGIINELPLRGVRGIRFTMYPEGRPPERQSMDDMAADLRVTPDYFRAMGIRVLQGRAPEAKRDTLALGEVAISRSLAQRYWPDENPVGRRLEVPGGVKFEIVGVVADVLPTTLESAPAPQAYFALLDSPYDNAAVVVSGRTSARTLTRTLERIVQEAAPSQAVYNVRSMEEVITSAIAPRRTNTLLITAFGALSLVLAVIGVYGVMAFSVTQRTREIGIRIALGARAAQVRRDVMGEAGAIALLGIGLGLAAAWALSRVLEGMVYGVTVRDPLAFVVAPVLLAMAAAFAALVPAQRATRVDPMQAIRRE